MKVLQRNTLALFFQKRFGSAWLHQAAHDPDVGDRPVHLLPQGASHSRQELGDPIHQAQLGRISGNFILAGKIITRCASLDGSSRSRL
jgi:hypothetical protein